MPIPSCSSSLVVPAETSRKSVANAVGLAGQLSGTGNLLECDVWVVGVLEPVKSPVAACLELLRETVALGARGNTAVLLAPTLGRSTPLGSAGVEDTHTTTYVSSVSS